MRFNVYNYAKLMCDNFTVITIIFRSFITFISWYVIIFATCKVLMGGSMLLHYLRRFGDFEKNMFVKFIYFLTYFTISKLIQFVLFKTEIRAGLL